MEEILSTTKKKKKKKKKKDVEDENEERRGDVREEYACLLKRLFVHLEEEKEENGKIGRMMNAKQRGGGGGGGDGRRGNAWWYRQRHHRPRLSPLVRVIRVEDECIDETRTNSDSSSLLSSSKIIVIEELLHDFRSVICSDIWRPTTHVLRFVSDWMQRRQIGQGNGGESLCTESDTKSYACDANECGLIAHTCTLSTIESGDDMLVVRTTHRVRMSDLRTHQQHDNDGEYSNEIMQEEKDDTDAMSSRGTLSSHPLSSKILSVHAVRSFISVASILESYIDTFVRCRSCGLPDTWLCVDAGADAMANVHRILCYACGEDVRISACPGDRCDMSLDFQVSAIGLQRGLRDSPL